jgi:hypothetical protein
MVFLLHAMAAVCDVHHVRMKTLTHFDAEYPLDRCAHEKPSFSERLRRSSADGELRRENEAVSKPHFAGKPLSPGRF